ncbi:MAG: nucleotidyltransferase domain-containing protein [Acidimicrobiales bacterium]
MAPAKWDVVEGKRVIDGRTLSEWASVAADEVAAAVDPLEIVLFGSVARGDDTPDSDIDLLVVFEHLPRPARHEAAATVRRAIHVPAAVDVLVTDLDELAERGDLPGALRVARREGRVLHARAR